MTTYVEAIDQTYKMFTDAWTAGAAAILLARGARVVGYTPEVRYMRVEKETDLPRDKYFARLSHVTLSEDMAAIGNRMFDGEILFTMQIMCPRNDMAAYDVGRRLAMLARNAVRGLGLPSGDGMFREARINELPNENDWIVFSAQATLYNCEYVEG